MIYVLMGKSAVGKDTVLKKLLEINNGSLNKIIQYTTRPIKENEKNGVEYYFVDEAFMKELENKGQIVERRLYRTVYGNWYYFTANEEIDIEKKDYILIGTLEVLACLREYYGREYVNGIYLSLDDGERLQRALTRERGVKNPRYAEMCRRFLTDNEDFSEESLEKQRVEYIVDNTDLNTTLKNITDFIKKR